MDAAVAGLGITRVLDYQAASAIRAGKLQVALADYEPQPWPISLVFGGQRPLPQKVRACLDFAAPRLREALSTPVLPPGGAVSRSAARRRARS